MKNEYTMQEFIKEFKLGVNIKDSASVRLVAARLRELGYIRKMKRVNGGNAQPVWIKGDPHADLKAKLGGIE